MGGILSHIRSWLSLSVAIGLIGGIIGVLGGGLHLFHSVTTNATIREWVLSLALALMTATALIALAVTERRLGRQSKLVSTLSHQERASEVLRDLRIYLRRFGPSSPDLSAEVLARARAMIGDVLSVYAEIFSILTSTRCRTCIKLVEVLSDAARPTRPAPEDVLIFTLARDGRSEHEERHHDKRRADQRLDKLTSNTDFMRLWNPESDASGYFSQKICPEIMTTRQVPGTIE